MKKLALGLIFLLSAFQLHAALLFENPYSDSALSTSAWCTSCSTTYRSWDSFSLAENSTITSIDSRLYISKVTSIEFSIWNLDRTAELYSNTFALSDMDLTGFSSVQFETTAYFSDLELAAGDYFLSIYAGDSDSWVGWYNTDTVDASGLQTIGADPFSGYNGGGNGKDFAFAVNGDATTTVPEPSSLALLAIGLAGLRLSRKKSAV